MPALTTYLSQSAVKLHSISLLFLGSAHLPYCPDTSAEHRNKRRDGKSVEISSQFPYQLSEYDGEKTRFSKTINGTSLMIKNLQSQHVHTRILSEVTL